MLDHKIVKICLWSFNKITKNDTALSKIGDNHLIIIVIFQHLSILVFSDEKLELYMIFAKLMVKSKHIFLFSPAVTSLRGNFFLGHRMSAERNIELNKCAQSVITSGCDAF